MGSALAYLALYDSLSEASRYKSRSLFQWVTSSGQAFCLHAKCGRATETVEDHCDVSKGTDVKHLCTAIKERHGRLDYAFNNGGSGGRSAPVATTTEEAWRKTIDGFLTSVFLCMRHQIPLMPEGGGGVIVNNSSVDGLRGYPLPGGAAYSAAKHGVLGLTKSAALEHATSGLRRAAISPLRPLTVQREPA